MEKEALEKASADDEFIQRKGSKTRDRNRGASAGGSVRSTMLSEHTMTSHSTVFLQEEDEPGQDEMDHTGSEYVLHEGNPIRFAWNTATILLLGYTATVFLYRFTFFSFHIGPNGLEPIGEGDLGWVVVNHFVDAFFWVDLFVNFLLSYKDKKGREVDSVVLIARNYLRCFFWINLVACLPEQAVSPVLELTIIDGDESPHVDFRVARVYRLQRISRLARLARITRLLKLAQVPKSSSSVTVWFNQLRGVRVINFICGLLWALHLLACGWYLCAALHNDVQLTWVARRTVDPAGTSLLQQGPFEQWLVSMYFVLTVFTTVGFGDISANTEGEIVYVALTMVIGAVVHSIIISEVIGIIVSTDQIQQAVLKASNMIDAYSAHAQISPETARNMKREITWRAQTWARSHGFDKGDMKELLTGKYMPRWLIAQVPQSLFCGKLMMNKFISSLSQVPPRLPCLLAVHLMSTEFIVGESVYQMYDFPCNIFLIMSGTFAHVARPFKTGGKDSVEPEVDCAPSQKSGPGVVALAKARLFQLQSHPNLLGNVCEAEPSAKEPSYRLYPYQLFSHGSYFGDVEVIEGCSRVSSVRCEKAGSALALHKQDFAEIQDTFPHCAAVWKMAAAHREKMRLRSLTELNSGLTYRNLAAKRIQTFVRERRRPSSSGAKSTRPLAQVGQELLRRACTGQRAGHSAHHLGIAALRTDLDMFRSEVRSELRQLRELVLQGALARNI